MYQMPLKSRSNLALSNAAGKIGLNIKEKPENWKKTLYFLNIHNAKTQFLNSLKLGREVGNHAYF